MAKLITTVHVRDDAGEAHIFSPGDTVPGWAADKITNPNVWADVSTAPDELSGSAAAANSVPIPTKGGKGSGLDKWQAYAKFVGFEADADATREDIIEALEAEGIPTE